MKFRCSRSCRWAEAQDICRFNAILPVDGVVNSHTTTVKVKIQNPEVLRAVVERLGGTWLGKGTHRLYGANHAAGWGFTLPGWAYTLVLGDNGKLSYDSYRREHGSVEVDRLEALYALEAAARAAESQGWLVERQEDRVVIYHPSGGTLTVLADGTVDALGFVGNACHQAADVIVSQLGTVTNVTIKPEGQCQAIPQRMVE